MRLFKRKTPTTTPFSARTVANECPKGRTSARCAATTSVTTRRSNRDRSSRTPLTPRRDFGRRGRAGWGCRAGRAGSGWRCRCSARRLRRPSRRGSCGAVDERHAGGLAVERRAEGADHGVGAVYGAPDGRGVGELAGDHGQLGVVEVELGGVADVGGEVWPAASAWPTSSRPTTPVAPNTVSFTAPPRPRPWCRPGCRRRARRAARAAALAGARAGRRRARRRGRPRCRAVRARRRRGAVRRPA